MIMKYSRAYQHTDGKWYVMKGNNNFFTGRSFDNESDALTAAKFKSAMYYMDQAKKALANDDVKETLETWGDNFASLRCQVEELMAVVKEAHEKHDDYDELDPCTFMH